jgi:hypothetical protein
MILTLFPAFPFVQKILRLKKEKIWDLETPHSGSWRSWFLCARHRRVFFHMAGGRPFGKSRRIVFVGVLDDGVEDVQRDGGLMRGIFQAAGRPGLRAQRRALGRDRGFKGGDVRVELRDEGGGQADADELRGEGDGIRGEGAGGVEQRLVAVVVRHEKFSGHGIAQQRKRMRGVGDGDHVVMQMKAPGDFAKDGAVGLFAAGNLRGSKAGRAGDGSVDEGELLSAQAGGRKIRGVFDAEGVHGFEGSYETADFLFHISIPFPFFPSIE